jgi:integrase/recombinase XerD
MTVLATHLSAFLREHLPRERNASPHTVATYAHAFALLVRFAAQRLKRRPSDLTIEDIDPDLVFGV